MNESTGASASDAGASVPESGGVILANRHFAKIADVWKHLPLVEAVAAERPGRYWESHAGSAAYTMVSDAERAYGARRFFEVASDFSPLASSRYFGQLRDLNPAGRLDLYPGSALLAMRERSKECSYVVCDLDGDSTDDLGAWAARLGVDATVVGSDGNAALYERIDGHELSDVFVHVDPYDPWSVGTSGVCALDLAAAVADDGGGLMYWYGYSSRDERAWAFDELVARTRRTGLWCGDILVDSPESDTGAGDLGVATTPGTGFGIVVANVSERTLILCESLGTALSAAYAGAALPDGSRGNLVFTTQHFVRG